MKKQNSPADPSRRAKLQHSSDFSLTFNRAEIARYYSKRVPELKQTRNRQWRGPCPVHVGVRNSFAVDSQTGLWFCHSECNRGGSIYDLEQILTGVSRATAVITVRSIMEANI